jgi:hypothetical protein
VLRRLTRLTCVGVVLLAAGAAQLTVVATPSEAATCTRLTGTIKGSDGSAVNAQIGVDLVGKDGSLLHTPGYDGPYGVSPVNVNPDLPATGAAAKGNTLKWSTGCFTIPKGVAQVAVEVYPKAPVAGRPTDKTKYGAVEIHGITAAPGTLSANLVLPVRQGNGHDGNTGDIDGYVHYNGKPLPGADVNGNKQFKVKVWPADTSSSCGSHGWSADSDNEWTDDPNGFFQIDALAAGQCNAPSQAYTIHLECDTTLCGAEPGRTRTYTPSPDVVKVVRGKTTFWGFDLHGPSRAVTPEPPSAPTVSASAATLPTAGGQVTFTSTSTLASGITLTTTPGIPAGPQTVPVDENGAVSAALTFPPNDTAGPIMYQVQATATSSVADVPGATVTITQAPTVAYALDPSTGQAYEYGGEGWQRLGSLALWSLVPSADGNLYGIARVDGGSYRYTAAGWVEIGADPMTSLAAGPGGALYGVSARSGIVYSYDGQPCVTAGLAQRCEGWQRISDIGVRSIATGSDGTLYGIELGNEAVWQDTATGGWQEIDDAATSSIAVTGTQLFSVHRWGGETFRYTGTPCSPAGVVPRCPGWQEIDNGAMAGLVAGNGTVYATDDATGGTYAFTGAPCVAGTGMTTCGGWTEIYRGFLTDLSAGNGTVYGVNGVTGRAYAFSGGSGGSGGWRAVSAAPGGTVITAG